MLSKEDKLVYPYQPNQRVSWNNGDISGTGIVVGKTSDSNVIPGYGIMWIVKLEKPLPSGFDCIVVPSCGMEPLETL